MTTRGYKLWKGFHKKKKLKVRARKQIIKIDVENVCQKLPSENALGAEHQVGKLHYSVSNGEEQRSRVCSMNSVWHTSSRRYLTN